MVRKIEPYKRRQIDPSLQNKNGFGKFCPEHAGRGLLSNVVNAL